MSLYRTLDTLNELVKHRQRPNKRLHKLKIWLYHFYMGNSVSFYNNDLNNEFLNTLIGFVKQRIAKNDYQNLDIEINYIKKNVPNIDNDMLFTGILKDLESLKANQTSPPHCPSDPVLKKYSDPAYRVLDIDQNNDPYTGKSPGNCYGFTMAMADEEISPILLQQQRFTFNKRVHRYQQNQVNREKDQKKIKRTRLTGQIYCPDANEQAKKITRIGNKYQQKDLMLETYGDGAHATYLKISNNIIHYMDPNHGGYQFSNEDDFINFYAASMHRNGHQPHSFSLIEMKYDVCGQEKKSFLGKWRSLLTGAKYYHGGGKIVERTTNLLVYGGLGLILGGAIGLSIAASAPFMTAFLVPVLAICGAAYGIHLLNRANAHGFRGLLSVPYHFFHVLFHKKNEPPQEELATENSPLLTSSSTCKTFRGLGHYPHLQQGAQKGRVSVCQPDKNIQKPTPNSGRAIPEKVEEESLPVSIDIGQSSKPIAAQP